MSKAKENKDVVEESKIVSQDVERETVRETNDSSELFRDLLEVDVSKYKEQKGKLDYISWARAYREIVKRCPTFTYKVKKNENGMPFFKDESGVFVFTECSVGETTREMWLPVMDFRNNASKNPTTTEINKTIMRCLTKNIAMFGLGLDLYAGEDIPDENDGKTSNGEGAFTDKRSVGKNVSDIATPEQVKLLNDLVKSVTKLAIEKTGAEISEADLKNKLKNIVGEEINSKMGRERAGKSIEILYGWEENYKTM